MASVHKDSLELAMATSTEAEGGNTPCLLGLDYQRKCSLCFDPTTNTCIKISKDRFREGLFNQGIEIPATNWHYVHVQWLYL